MGRSKTLLTIGGLGLFGAALTLILIDLYRRWRPSVPEEEPSPLRIPLAGRLAGLAVAAASSRELDRGGARRNRRYRREPVVGCAARDATGSSMESCRLSSRSCSTMRGIGYIPGPRPPGRSPSLSTFTHAKG